MRTNRQSILAMLLLGSVAIPCFAQTKTKAVDWRAACQRLKTYTSADDTADRSAVENFLFQASPAQRAEVEAVLLKLLRDPQATDDAKQFICQQGRYMTSDEAVKVLAELQADPKFSYWACYALLRMPNPNVRPALREALGKRSGRPLVELLHVLGSIRDKESVPAMAQQLKNADRAAARTAVVALSQIASEEAEAALAAFEPSAGESKDLVADARLRCAAALGGARAAAICNAYRKSPSQPLRAAAYVGLLKFEPAQRNARLIEVIRGNDLVLKNVAYREARQGGDAELTRLLADSLPALPPAERGLLLGVLRDRADPAVLPQVLKLAEGADPAVRCEAISTIGILGDVAQLGRLLKVAANETEDLQLRAQEALARLKGPGVDAELAKLAQTTGPSERKVIIAAMVARGSEAALPPLLKLAEDADVNIRREAIRGLAKLAGMPEYPELVHRMLSCKAERDRVGYQNAVLKVYQRSKEPEKCARLLLETLKQSGDQAPAALFEVLAGVGSPQVWTVLAERLKSPDAEIRKVVLRSLGNWPDARPVPQLIDLARHADEVAVKVLALRAGVAIVTRDKTLAPAEKVKMLAEMLKVADRVDEKRLVVAALGEVRCNESVALATEVLDTPELATESALAVVQLAKYRKLFPLNAGQLKVVLQKAAGAKTSPAAHEAVQQQLKTF